MAIKPRTTRGQQFLRGTGFLDIYVYAGESDNYIIFAETPLSVLAGIHAWVLLILPCFEALGICLSQTPSQPGVVQLFYAHNVRDSAKCRGTSASCISGFKSNFALPGNRFHLITRQSLINSMCWEWQTTPVFSPGESHGQRSLAGYSPWGGKELDMTEWPALHCYVMRCQISPEKQAHCFLSSSWLWVINEPTFIFFSYGVDS